ncbi:MAG: hypothetical protein WCL44_00610 [bacterium]
MASLVRCSLVSERRPAMMRRAGHGCLLLRSIGMAVFLAGCAVAEHSWSAGQGTNAPITPKEVMLLKNESIPLLIEGQVAGYATYRRGAVLKVDGVVGDKIVVVGGDEKHLIPVASTDFQERVDRLVKARQPAAASVGQEPVNARDDAKLKALARKYRAGFFVGSIERIAREGFYVKIDWIGTPGAEYKRRIGCLDDYSYPVGTVFVAGLDTSDLEVGDRWSSGSEVGGQSVYGDGVFTNSGGRECLRYTPDFEKYYTALTNALPAATP